MQSRTLTLKLTAILYTVFFATKAKAYSFGAAAIVFITGLSDLEASQFLFGLMVLVGKSFIGSIIGLLCKKMFDMRLPKKGGNDE